MTLRIEAKLQADRQQPTTDRAELLKRLEDCAEKCGGYLADTLRRAAAELSKPVADAANTRAARELAEHIYDDVKTSMYAMEAAAVIGDQADTIDSLRAQLDSVTKDRDGWKRACLLARSRRGLSGTQ